MSWEIKQSARYEGNDRWKWAVWIEAPRFWAPRARAWVRPDGSSQPSVGR